jgi:2-phospho-L-lactate/phosphoenolpyruvate guanylyltransferase
MIRPPSRGMFSSPDQVRRVMIVIVGLMTTTAKRRQKPSLRRATDPSSLCRGPRDAHAPFANHACLSPGGSSPGCEDRCVVPAGWVAVVPIKPLPVAKSRLRGAVADGSHHRLVLAMAKDTVAAALASHRLARVLVVTDDRLAGSALAAVGAEWVPDAPRAGLNAAFAHGARLAAHGARRGARGPSRGVVALAADLPALVPADLAAALDAAAGIAAGDRAFVADAAGTGTVLLTALAGADLDPRFGAGSAVAHARSGAVPLTGHWPGLRRDVDTAQDLTSALALGVGRFTAELVMPARYGVDRRS